MLWVVRYPLNGGSDWALRPRKSVPFPLIEVSHRRGSTACCLQHCWSCNFAELFPHMNPVYGLVHYWVFCIAVVMHTADRNNLKVSSPHGDPNFSLVPYLWNANTVLSSLSSKSHLAGFFNFSIQSGISHPELFITFAILYDKNQIIFSS